MSAGLRSEKELGIKPTVQNCGDEMMSCQLPVLSTTGTTELKESMPVPKLSQGTDLCLNASR